MFGRRKQEEDPKEAERRALFAELAKRPDTVCPFLGLADARTRYREGVSDEHRCYAFGDPAELSAEQQTKVCLERGYGNCPRYLRGVLVIPTEELEALRHPQASAPPEAIPAAASGGRRRLGAVVAAVVVLVAAGGGVAAFLTLRDNGVAVASRTPTPAEAPSVTPALSSAQETAGLSSTPEPTPSPTPVALPSGGVLPTPGPDDTPTGFAVRADPGRIPVVEMLHDGTIVRSAENVFDNQSWAPVERIKVDGVVYWRTLQGGYTGRAYSRSLSEGFTIFETFQTPSGDPTFRKIGKDEY